MLRRLDSWAYAGLAALVAAVGLLIVAAFNLDYPACAPGEPADAGVGPGGTYGACGIDPVPLAIGALALLVVGGLILSSWARRR